jgi:hypothetical protein
MRLFWFLFLVFATPVFGQLKWDNEQQVFETKPQEKAIETKYRFTNIGTSPISIEEVRTSCGCTTATLKKKEYAPGETGEIEAKFVFAGRIGHQEKWIIVTTSFAPMQPTVLRLVANIPETLTIQPEFVMWQVGDPVQSKTIHVRLGDEFPGKIVSIQADNAAVKLELHEVRPGRELEVIVTPANTRGPAKSILSVRTDYPTEDPVIHQAYARVE